MRSQVSYEDRLVFTAWSDHRRWDIVPGKWAHSSLVTVERSNPLFVIDVPDLDLSWLCSDTEMSSAVWPAEGGNLVLETDVTQLFYCWGCCVPHINRTFKSHGQNILSWPIHQVEIEIICEPWSIKNPVRIRSDLSWLCLLPTLCCRVVDEHLLSVDEPTVEVVLESLFLRFWVLKHFATEDTFLSDILLTQFLMRLLTNLIILFIWLFDFEFVYWNILVG